MSPIKEKISIVTKDIKLFIPGITVRKKEQQSSISTFNYQIYLK